MLTLYLLCSLTEAHGASQWSGDFWFVVIHRGFHVGSPKTIQTSRTSLHTGLSVWYQCSTGALRNDLEANLHQVSHMTKHFMTNDKITKSVTF